MDQELGIVLEPPEMPLDIYPFQPIDDTEKGIRGSCATYNERTDITEKAAAMSLEEVEATYVNLIMRECFMLLFMLHLC